MNGRFVRGIGPWLLSGLIALFGQQSGFAAGPDLTGATGNRDKLVQKLKTIVLKKIEFEETPIKNAVEFLVDQSRAADPLKDGVNILLTLAPEQLKDPSKAPTVSLNLRNVTLLQAIKFLTEVTGLKYRLESDAVVILPSTAVDDQRTQTRIYHMAPGVFRPEIERSSSESPFGQKKD